MVDQVPGSRDDPRSSPALVLRGETGSLAGRQIAVPGSPFTIGRNQDNSLMLSESQVSRYHARLELRGGRWFLQDLNASNGTFVNRQRLNPGEAVPLNDGDLVTLSDASFAVALRALPARQAGPEAAPGPRDARPRVPAAKPRRTSPVAAIVAGVLLLAIVAAAVWIIANQGGIKKEEEPAGLALPTISLPDIKIPTVELPASLPTLTIPTGLPTVNLGDKLPISTPDAELIAPLKTALPGLKLP